MPPACTGWLAMKIYTFDFDEIESQEDFYREFIRAFDLERGSVSNLDMLWDVVTGRRTVQINPRRISSYDLPLTSRSGAFLSLAHVETQLPFQLLLRFIKQ